MEIETHPRGDHQSSLSSIFSNRSLSQDYLRASELEERQEGGDGDEEDQQTGEKPGGEAEEDKGTVYPRFEIDGVWGPSMQALYVVED